MKRNADEKRSTILRTVMLSSWEEIRNMERYQNSSLSPAERAEDLLAKLSPEEKLAQTQCVQVAENRVNCSQTGKCGRNYSYVSAGA